MRAAVILPLALMSAFTANADLIGSTGQVSAISPPADVRVNLGIESNTPAFFFTERRDFTLPSGVSVNITTPGFSNSVASLTPGTIAAGTLVDSYYLHLDPVGATASLRINEGSITFDTDILGVIVLDAQFSASNATLGNPGTLYSASGQRLELGGPDTVTLAITGRTLSFHLGTNTAADDLRIVTVGSVPEPSAWILLLTCIALCIVVRRKHGATSRSL